MEKIIKVNLIGIVIISVLFISVVVNSGSDSKRKNLIYNENIISKEHHNNPNCAGYWELNTIIIDDNGGTPGALNWSQAVAQPEGWCSGAGTLKNPYRIENVTFNANNQESGLYIRDSNAIFILKNCTFINTNESLSAVGLHLYHANNGTIEGCYFFNHNYRGFYLHYCENITIYGNIFHDIGAPALDSNGYALTLFMCENFTISTNQFYDILGSSYHLGIAIQLGSCENFTINDNNIQRVYIGISIEACDNAEFLKNTFKNTELFAISVSDTNNSRFIENDMDGGSFGIYIETSHYNYFYKNTIINIGTYGIYLSESTHNTVTYNKFIDVYQCIKQENSASNDISNNECNSGNDDDDDANDENDNNEIKIYGYELLILFGIISSAILISLMEKKKILMKRLK